MSRRLAVWVFVPVLALAALVAFFPASWAWKLARDRASQVQMGSVHGSVWDGHAQRVVYAGVPLGDVRWLLSRTALWGRLRLDLQIDGPLLHGKGHLQRDGDVLVGRKLHVTVHADRLPVSIGSPGLRPLGDVDIDIRHVRVRDRWPQQLDGAVVWKHAALADASGPVALGDLHADLRERAGTTLEARLGDGGGPLALSGLMQASLLGWRVDARLQPRSDKAQLRRVLAYLGPVQQDGTLILRHHGGAVMGARP